METPFKPRAPPMDGERDLAVRHAENTVVHPALWLAMGGWGGEGENSEQEKYLEVRMFEQRRATPV